MTKSALELEVDKLEAEIAGVAIEVEKEDEPEVEELDEKPEPEPEKPEVKEEPKLETRVETDSYAKLRWERAEEKRRADALEVELAALKNPPKELPDKSENWEAHIDAKTETLEDRINRLERENNQSKAKTERNELIEGAKREFTNYEEEFKTKTPNYEDARLFMLQNIAAGIKILNPSITRESLIEGVQNALLMRGREAVLNGYNPAAAIYQEAQGMGWHHKAAEPEKKSNLSAIAENRKKSVGMAGSSASGSNGMTTVESALKLSNAEFSRMSESDFARLESEARGF